MRRNQDMFRQANERLRNQVVGAGTTDHRHVPFFCECADEACHGRVEATLDEFEEAHMTYDHYFILPGHSRIEGEESTEDNRRYQVVVKESV